MLQHFDSHGIPKTEYYVQIRRLAAQFVQDRSNPARLRLDIMLRYCLYNDIPEYNAARKTLPALLKELNYNYARDGGFTYRMARNYQLGNYAITAEIGDAFADHGLFGNVK